MTVKAAGKDRVRPMQTAGGPKPEIRPAKGPGGQPGGTLRTKDRASSPATARTGDREGVEQ